MGLRSSRRYYIQQSLFVVAWVGVQVMAFPDLFHGRPFWLKVLVGCITCGSAFVALYLFYHQVRRELISTTRKD